MEQMTSTFAVIYRFYLDETKEQEYVTNWNKVASYFMQERGAIGSTLHKTNEGYWLAYSLWPDKETRDASWSKEGVHSDLPEIIQLAIIHMKNCIDTEKEPFDEICMDVVGLSKKDHH